MDFSIAKKEGPLNFCFEQIVHINSFINQKVRTAISILLLIFLDVAFILKPVLNLQYTGYYAIICLAFSVFFSIGELPSKRINKSGLLYILFVLSVMYIVSAFMFKDGNRIILAGCFGIMIPLAGMVLTNEKNYTAFFYAFCMAENITFVLLLIASIALAPFFDCQYSSILLNPNGLSTVLISAIIANIWMIEYYLSKKQSGKISYQIVLLSIIFAFEITFLILSRSRTGILAIGTVVAIWFIYRMLHEKKYRHILKKSIIMVVLCVVALNFTTGVLSKVNIKLIEAQYSNYGVARFFSMKHFIEIDEIEGFYYMLQNNGNLDESADLSKYKIFDFDGSSKDALAGAFDRLSKGSKGEDVSSGRFEIWKCVIKASNLKGHAFSDSFYVPGRKEYINDAHNMILAVAFQMGWPAALVMVLLLGANFLNLLRIGIFILKNKKVPFRQFHYSMTLCAFFILAMFSNTYTPIGSMIGIMFWFMQPIEKLSLEKYE